MLADGARADVFERLLAAGELPQIARHVVARGDYRRATSTFTSTTIPAHLPILTGNFAGTANVPGYRFFDRGARRRGLPLGPWCLRSYTGPEVGLVNRDIAPQAKTLFELTTNAINVFGPITRGLGRGGNLAPLRKGRLWLNAHYRDDLVSPDVAGSELLAGSIGAPGAIGAAEVRLAVLPGIDWSSHYDSPFSEATLAAYRRVDATIGAIAARLQRFGRYEQTLLVVCSDHGLSPVQLHYDLAVRLQADHGLRVAYHSAHVLLPSADAVACVSGNSMAHVYLRGAAAWGRDALTRAQIDAAAPGLIRRLVAEPAIDVVLTRGDAGAIEVQSTGGRATLRDDGDWLYYEPASAGADPFGYPPLPSRMSLQEALELTFDSGHPDGLVQAAQIFRSARTGDVVVSSMPGHDLRERYERPEHRGGHGALHADHMLVPVAFSHPLVAGPMRTTDVFSSTMAWLGRPATSGVDGVSRLLT